mgnify:CR=1 FL=1
MSKEQLREIKEVLYRPKFSKYITPAEVDELISLLSIKAIVPVIYENIIDCRDPKDNMILEEAVYGNAQYIITGDDDPQKYKLLVSESIEEPFIRKDYRK